MHAPETKNRHVLNDNDMPNKNTWCLVLEKVVPSERASCDRNGRVIGAWLVQSVHAFFGLAFWQCLASLVQSAHRCSTLPTLLVSVWLYVPGTCQKLRPCPPDLVSWSNYLFGSIRAISASVNHNSGMYYNYSRTKLLQFCVRISAELLS